MGLHIVAFLPQDQRVDQKQLFENAEFFSSLQIFTVNKKPIFMRSGPIILGSKIGKFSRGASPPEPLIISSVCFIIASNIIYFGNLIFRNLTLIVGDFVILNSILAA